MLFLLIPAALGVACLVSGTWLLLRGAKRNEVQGRLYVLKQLLGKVQDYE